MNNPALTVIIPVYNGSQTLAATLDSLVDQGDHQIEVLAIDQNSTDGSRQILEKYSERLSLNIIAAPDSKNWMTNTNIGLSAASAPLVSMLHQDDIWLPGRVSAMLGLSRKYPDAELWLHPAWFMDADDRLHGIFGPAFGATERLIEGRDAMRSLIVQNTIALPSAMFKRKTALKVGGLSEELWYTADWDFWLKLIGEGPIAWAPEKLAAFRIHEGSQTVKGSRDIKDFENQLSIPVDRHVAMLPESDIERSRALAQASNILNVYLAARYHNQPISIVPFLGKFIRLGPLGWIAFMKDTRIFARTLPRLRSLRRSKGKVV